jgi:DNA-binding XRE family transcriptional regulator
MGGLMTREPLSWTIEFFTTVRGTSPVLEYLGREMTANTNIRFEDWEADQMKDPEFRAAVEELEPAYQVARLRILRGLTQQQLAERVGARQPSIARLESGRGEPKLGFLKRVAGALGAKVEVRIVPLEETSGQ